MNAKNRLIEKLLQIAKQHKILTYPVLALVAVISVFHYLFSWSTGAGKRIVAVVMILVMLVSQSYFLTSSATELVDTEESVQQQEALQEQENNGLVSEEEQEDVTNQDLVEDETQQEGVTESDSEDISQDGPVDVVQKPEEDVTESEVVDSTQSEFDEDVYVDDTISNSSSKTPSEDVPETKEEVDQAAGEEEERVVVKFVAFKDGSASEIHECYAVKNEGSDTYAIESATWESDANTKLALNANDGNYLTYQGWYTTQDYSVKVNSSVASSLTLSDTGIIWLYAKRNITNYKVSIGSAGTVSPYTVTGATADAVNSGVYAVPASPAGNSYNASFVIVNPQRAGYVLSGIDTSNSGAGVSATVNGNDLNIFISGDTYQQHVQLAWEAEAYNISYSTGENGSGDIVESTVTYDGTDATDIILSDAAVGVEDKDGYVFAGWETNGGAIRIPKNRAGNTFVSSIPELQSYAYNCWKNQSTAVLSPYYEYSGVELLKDKISYQYKKTETTPQVITAVYKNDGLSSDTFSYEIGSITDGSGAVINPADFGINISAADGRAITVGTADGGPTQVVTIVSEVLVTDSRVNDPAEGTTSLTLTITVNPCELQLDVSAIDEFTKVYDGTTDCDFLGQIPTNVEGVFVVVTSSEFDSANAGDRQVILTRPDSDWLLNDLPSNYVVDENADGNLVAAGKIKQRPVNVRTYAVISGNKDYIRAGESNPVFRAEEIASDEEDEGLVAADKNRLNDIISLKEDPVRDDSILTVSRDVTYRVVPEDTADSNYKFNFNYNDLGTFKVRLEAADALFDYAGKRDSGWFGSGSKIFPKSTSGYDRISMSDETVQNEIILTEEMAEDGNITFRLHDSVTNAYTAPTTFPIKVDLTKPEYIGCEVIENAVDAGPGLYFPSAGGQVSFGHYYNKSITFRISFRDTASGASKLVYSLSGNLTDAVDGKGQELTFVNRTDDVSVFTFTIPVKDLIDQKGGIQFYAIDAAENQSDLLDLVSQGDQWIVEKTAPEIDLTIKAGGTSATDGETITGEEPDTYYGKVKAYLTASDATSPITSITWVINGEEHTNTLTDEDLQISTTLPINTSTFEPREGGVYTVSAYVTDKAGNDSLTTTPITFKVDDENPVVSIDDGYDAYLQEVKLQFNAYDELSGVKYVNVKDLESNKIIPHVVEKTENNEGGYSTSYCYIETNKKGSYIIEVSDNAGNIFSETIVLDKVSNEVPLCPTVTFNPELSEEGWITSKDAVATISNITYTQEDGTPVETKYKLWLEGEEARNITVIDPRKSQEQILLSLNNPLIDEEGIYVLSAWSQSATGVLCDGAEETHGHEYVIKLDTEKPEISEPSFSSTGKRLTVTVEVTDTTSGVNPDSVQVVNNERSVPIKSLEPNENGDGYLVSFEVSTVGDYQVIASDFAGNQAEELAFRPMSLRLHEVQDLSPTSAYLSAYVKKGTFDITSATISYGKFGDKVEDYQQLTTADTYDAAGNLTVSAELNNLDPDTNYVFIVVANSEKGEQLTGNGAFKTPSNNGQGITLKGTARYADPDKEGSITVGLFDGDVCIEATVVDTYKDTEKDESFIFDNIPDGNYTIVAKDGNCTQTVKVLIKDGTLLTPQSNIIDLVLSGFSTSVEILTDDTPHISADFNNIMNDPTNYTEEDRRMVELGLGTVEFKLYASIKYVEQVSAEEKEAMYNAPRMNGKLVGAYIDLSLVKIVTDSRGVETTEQVHTLGNGANISVTVPLTEFLTRQSGIVVVGIHNNGSEDSPQYVAHVYDPDYDANPSTYTFEANTFSTFSLLYDPVVEPGTTEDIKDGTIGPSDNGSIYEPQEGTTIQPDEDDEIDEDDNDKKDKKDDKEKKKDKKSSVGSLKSSGSAKTGDGTPIEFLFVFLMLSLGGIIVLQRKMKS